jgi:curli biogenesis system outer membrane secretion channel CsgG
MHRRISVGLAVVLLLSAAGCATEGSRALPVEKVQAAATPYTGTRAPVSIGKFDNRSNFMRGAFSDGVDRLGSQAKITLISHLQQSQRFSVLDRDNMAETSQEAKLQGTAQALRGASYVITGDVTEFGRKDVGDKQLFGILGRGKSQIAYAKITLNVVNAPRSCSPRAALASTSCRTARCSASAAPPATTLRSTARFSTWPYAKP